MSTEAPMHPADPVHPSPEAPKAAKPPMVIVELDEPQSTLAVRRLRKGKGRLFTQVGRIVDDLVEDGTVKTGAQPIVIVVQEMPSPPWAFRDDDD